MHVSLLQPNFTHPLSLLQGAGVTVEPVIAVLVFSCNRVTVTRCLDQLIKFRPSKQQFPIVVTQDCGHQATADAIASYGDLLTHIQVCYTKLHSICDGMHASLK